MWGHIQGIIRHGAGCQGIYHLIRDTYRATTFSNHTRLERLSSNKTYVTTEIKKDHRALCGENYLAPFLGEECISPTSEVRVGHATCFGQ